MDAGVDKDLAANNVPTCTKALTVGRTSPTTTVPCSQPGLDARASWWAAPTRLYIVKIGYGTDQPSIRRISAWVKSIIACARSP